MGTGICWGALRPRAPSTQPYDRHCEQVTPGHPWYMSRRLGSETGLRPGILRWTPTLRAQMRQRHTARVQRPHGQTPNPRTRSHTDTLAQTHARAPRCEGPRGPTTKSRSECEPGGFYTQEVRTPLIDNHAPSGWLFDRGSGLRTRPWYQDAAPRTSPALSIYNGG